MHSLDLGFPVWVDESLSVKLGGDPLGLMTITVDSPWVPKPQVVTLSATS